MKSNFLILIILGLLISCHNQTRSNYSKPAEQIYQEAAIMMHEMKYDSALGLLRLAFENKFENPMKTVTDSSFYALIDNPQYRSKIRELLKEFAIENHATMIRESEPGRPILLKGMVRDESSNLPIENVLVELVHTDKQGYYFEEKSMWNPRLFSYLRTDSTGAFSINTIMPGRYHDDQGNELPSHIHFSLEADAYRLYSSEFTFENDSVLTAEGNIDNVPVAKLIKLNGKDHFEVQLFLQKE